MIAYIVDKSIIFCYLVAYRVAYLLDLHEVAILQNTFLQTLREREGGSAMSSRI